MNKIFKKTIFALSLSLLPFSVYAPLANASDTIKIGVAGPHTGDLATHGIPSLRAAEVAADTINAQGGLLGKQVEIIAADDQCRPELASNAATSLLSQNVVGVIGTICSGTTKAVLPLFTDAKVVIISPASTTPDLTLDKPSPYFMRTIGHDFIQGELTAKFIGSYLKPKKIAFLHDNADYGKSYTEVTRDRLEKLFPEIEVVLFEGVTAGASDYSAVVRKLRKSEAEALVWGGYHNDASKIVNNMRDFDMEIPLIGPDSIKDDAYIHTAGLASENSYASAPADTSGNPLSIEAAKAHKVKYNAEPGVFFDNAYAATWALMKAIEVAGTTDADKLVEVLQTNKVDTPIGTIYFDDFGDAQGIGTSMYKVENGQFIPVFANE